MGGERENARLSQEKWKIFLGVGLFNFLETGFTHETGDWDGEESHMSLKGTPC